MVKLGWMSSVVPPLPSCGKATTWWNPSAMEERVVSLKSSTLSSYNIMMWIGKYIEDNSILTRSFLCGSHKPTTFQGTIRRASPTMRRKQLKVHNVVTQWVGEAIPSLLRLVLLSTESYFESPSSNPHFQRRYLPDDRLAAFDKFLALCIHQSALWATP